MVVVLKILLCNSNITLFVFVEDPVSTDHILISTNYVTIASSPVVSTTSTMDHTSSSVISSGKFILTNVIDVCVCYVGVSYATRVWIYMYTYIWIRIHIYIGIHVYTYIRLCYFRY